MIGATTGWFSDAKADKKWCINSTRKTNPSENRVYSDINLRFLSIFKGETNRAATLALNQPPCRFSAVLEIPLKCTPRLNAHFPINHPLSLNTYKMVNEDNIKKALAETESSKASNYTIIARKYSLMRSTLSRRARGKPTSRAEFPSQVH
jgi:hypothetical protein